MDSEDFQGQTVVISGTDECALSIAARFGRSNAHVVIAGDETTRVAVVESLRNTGVAASFEALDARDPAQSAQLVRKVEHARQAIDVWVNSIGTALPSSAESLPQASWQNVLETTLSASFYCCQAVGRHMLERKRGVIVNVGTVNACQAIENGVARSVADAGLVMLTQALGIAWAPRQVRVVGVAVGPLPSLIADGMFGSVASNECERRTPMRRLGSPDELAEAVAFLASDEASFIVGETLRVDGGWAAYQLF